MNIAKLRADLPLLDEVVYLDAASTTPTPCSVVEAMVDYYQRYNANTGRGAYRLAVKATHEMQLAREKVARFIKASADEIIFTKNTTDAINLVSNGLTLKKGDSIVTTNMEHHSNLVPWLNLKRKGVEVKVVEADQNGVVGTESIERAFSDNTKLLTVSHISNSVGSIQPVIELGEIARDHDVIYLIDAAQSAGHMKLDIKKLRADLVAFPGHKGLMGPVGTGFLYAASGVQEDIEPTNLGGGTVDQVTEEDFQLTDAPARFEGGTQNIAGIIGLGTAIDYMDRLGLENIERRNKHLTKLLYHELMEVEKAVVYGSPENIYGIASFNIDGINPHDLAKILDELQSICVRSGHHCAIPSIRHIEAEKLGGTVRASLHYYNTKEEVEKLGETLREISKFLGD